MNHDDRCVGYLLSRRQTLELMGTAWLSSHMLFQGRAMAATHACVVRPEQGEGPFFIDDDLNRSDIRSDPANGELKSGVPLALNFMISTISNGNCQALEGAQVDIWHCDAMGLYSGVDNSDPPTSGEKFLRGFQTSDADGKVSFLTIYPGWYQRRAVHIHVKIRTDAGSNQGLEFTSQLYFDEALTDIIHEAAPYSEKEGNRVLNKNDRLFKNGGEQLILTPVKSDEAYEATFAIGLQMI